jgi:ubiquinone/menaquinone biosynthesis C-methylase UbiE
MAPANDNRKHRQHEVFSASRAGHLDNRLRQFIYRPDRLAREYVKYGDRVLDFGCGPGFFTRAFAQQVGTTGMVIAADVQDEMLTIVREKLGGDGLLPRIRTHRCAPDTIGLSPQCDGKIDVAFALFVVHEVPDPERLFREIATLLVPGGLLFYSEPVIIVSGSEFRDNLNHAREAGLRPVQTTWYFLNRAAVLKKEGKKR